MAGRVVVGRVFLVDMLFVVMVAVVEDGILGKLFIFIYVRCSVSKMAC